jgi:dehydrogenase/reductase SDR family protein 1
MRHRGKPKADLSGQVALVTGASRGVGKGIAIGLGEAGATVYVTGRTETEGSGVGPRGSLPGTFTATADAVTAAGGRGIPIRCDHTVEEDVRRAFSQIEEESERLDILVNNAWGGYERMFEDGKYTNEVAFWHQPTWRFDAMFSTGVRGAFRASQLAVPLMLRKGRGLIVNLSFWAAQTYLTNTPYGMAKAAVDKMTADTACELKRYRPELGGAEITVVSLYPGLVRTESVMEAADVFDLSNSESPQFLGRAVAALAADPVRLERTGEVVIAAELAQDYGFTDVDGKRPRPLSLTDLS